MNEETKVTQIVEQMKNGYEKGFAGKSGKRK